MNRPGFDGDRARSRGMELSASDRYNLFMAMAAAPIVFLMLVAPMKLVLPILSGLALMASVACAYAAHRNSRAQLIPGLGAQDASLVFGLMWIITAILGNPIHIVKAFGG
jgi:hypothetical protein